MNLFSIILFLSLSALAVVASLHAWQTRQKYGLFRFLGFETLAALIAWNTDLWFNEPFSGPQLASWALFLISAALAAHGLYLLTVIGRARRRIMEEPQTLVEIGAYKYIRHPLYASLIVFAWGVFFKGFDTVSVLLAIAVTVFLTLTARYEERYNRKYFGPAYAEYMKRTKMFIPFFFSL